jgi:hypothetical protein
MAVSLDLLGLYRNLTCIAAGDHLYVGATIVKVQSYAELH